MLPNDVDICKAVICKVIAAGVCKVVLTERSAGSPAIPAVSHQEILQLRSNEFDVIAFLGSFTDIMWLTAYTRDMSGTEKHPYLKKISLCTSIDNPDDYGAGDEVCYANLLTRVKFAFIKLLPHQWY